MKLLFENWRQFVKQEVEEFLPHGEVRAVEKIGSSVLPPEEQAKQDLEKYGYVRDEDDRDIDIEVEIAGITNEEAEEWAFSREAQELEDYYNYDVQLRIVENWRKFVSEDVDPKMKKYLKKHPYMEPDQLQDEAVEDVYTGNCGMFGIALAEEAQRRGVDASLVFAHNADTDQELAYGDYKLYHVALKIGDKYYDGRGEIQLKELVSFMWEKPEDMNVDAFNLKNLELMKDAIRRNTAWTQTCEYYREQASEFLDEMGYEALSEESEFQTKMKKNLPAELDFLLNKGPHNKKEGPGVKNPKKPKFKSAPPGAEGG